MSDREASREKRNGIRSVASKRRQEKKISRQANGVRPKQVCRQVRNGNQAGWKPKKAAKQAGKAKQRKGKRRQEGKRHGGRQKDSGKSSR